MRNIIILLLLINTSAMAQLAPLYHGISPSNTWYNDTALSHTAMQPYFETTTQTTSNNKWLKRALFDDPFLQFNSEQANILSGVGPPLAHTCPNTTPRVVIAESKYDGNSVWFSNICKSKEKFLFTVPPT